MYQRQLVEYVVGDLVTKKPIKTTLSPHIAQRVDDQGKRCGEGEVRERTCVKEKRTGCALLDRGMVEAGESKSRIQKELGGLNLERGVVCETGGIYNILFANYAIE